MREYLQQNGHMLHCLSMKASTTANIFLILAAIIWGMTFTVIKAAVTQIDPAVFVVMRFIIANAVFVILIRKKLKYTNRRLLKQTVILGFFNSLIYISQTVGLQYESSANIAFLNALNVVFIPLLSPLFGMGKPKPLHVICCFISVVGIYILTGANFHALGIGDLMGILSALSFAVSTVYLHKVTKKVRDSGLLAFWQIFFTLPLPMLLAINHPVTHLFQPVVLFALLYCALFSTCLTFHWQTKYQRKTTPTKAALIYMLEPVFAVIFAYLINHEPIFINTLIGGIVILFSVLLSELGDFTFKKMKKIKLWP